MYTSAEFRKVFDTALHNVVRLKVHFRSVLPLISPEISMHLGVHGSQEIGKKKKSSCHLLPSTYTEGRKKKKIEFASG